MHPTTAEKIKLAKDGSRRVRITFDPECRDIIDQFLELAERCYVEISEEDDSVLRNIAESSCSCKHHMLLVAFGNDFDADWFSENIGPAIENIEVA